MRTLKLLAGLALGIVLVVAAISVDRALGGHARGRARALADSLARERVAGAASADSARAIADSLGAVIRADSIASASALEALTIARAATRERRGRLRPDTLPRAQVDPVPTRPVQWTDATGRVLRFDAPVPLLAIIAALDTTLAQSVAYGARVSTENFRLRLQLDAMTAERDGRARELRAASAQLAAATGARRRGWLAWITPNAYAGYGLTASPGGAITHGAQVGVGLVLPLHGGTS